MNILMITPDYPPVYGGIGTHVDFLTKDLIKQGNDVTLIIIRISGNKRLNSTKNIITSKNEKLMLIDISNYSIEFLENKGFYIDEYYNKEISIMEACGNILNVIFECLPKKKFDIIHIHDGYAGFLGKILSKCLKVPLITTIHSMHADKTSLKYYLREYAVNNSIFVIAVSHFIKNKIVQYYHTSSDIIKVIHNSISVESVQEYEKKSHMKYLFVEGTKRLKVLLLFYLFLMKSYPRSYNQLITIKLF
ncbi:MAG: glycosyltransferase family 4 protein [Eubacterium sp.]|nr:glycosyltransferase family 4 protein [Eubacterium sp.]